MQLFPLSLPLSSKVNLKGQLCESERERDGVSIKGREMEYL